MRQKLPIFPTVYAKPAIVKSEQTSLKLCLSPKRDYTSLPLEIGIVLLRFTYVVEIIKKYNVILFLTL